MYLYFLPNSYKEVRYYVKENRATLNDNIFLGSLGDTKKLNFYTINKKTIDQGILFDSKAYLSIIITLDQEVDLYNRTVYSFFDMLGFLGGMFGLVHSVAFIFVQFVANRQFYAFVISKVFTNSYTNMNQDNIDLHNKNSNQVHKNIVRHKLSSINKNKISPLNKSQNLMKEKSNQSNNLIEEGKKTFYILL